MKHARSDYDRIQDPSGKIPEDEPVFLLRAQDMHFIPTLVDYRNKVASYAGDRKILAAVTEHITRAIKWQQAHGVKAPDMPEQS